MLDLLSLGLLVGLAGGMAVVTAYLIRWTSEARFRTSAAVVLFLFAMMIEMLGAAAAYYVAPSGGRLLLALWGASAAMSVSVFPVLAIFLREGLARHGAGAAYRPAPVGAPRRFIATVVGLVVVNELLMGWTFGQAAGTAGAVGPGPADGLAALFVAPWFVLPMAFEMAVTVAWLRPRFPAGALGLFAVQPVVMAASPPTFGGSAWVVGSAVVAGIAMTGALAGLLYRLYRGDWVPPAVLAYGLALFGTFGAMGVGLAWWALGGGVGLYSLSVAGQMLVFLFAILSSAGAGVAAEPGERPDPRASGPPRAASSGRPTPRAEAVASSRPMNVMPTSVGRPSGPNDSRPPHPRGIRAGEVGA